MNVIDEIVTETDTAVRAQRDHAEASRLLAEPIYCISMNCMQWTRWRRRLDARIAISYRQIVYVREASWTFHTACRAEPTPSVHSD